METIRSIVNKNPFRDHCIPAFTKAKRDMFEFDSVEKLWGGNVRVLQPNRLTTAWQLGENPMMTMASSGYSAAEVRDRTFELQQEAATNLRGNRKLSKVKVADALASVKPNTDQTKIVAGVLYALKKIQTICFNEEKKEIWTVPDDLRAWSASYRTLWVDGKCERCVEWDTPISMSKWISNRESEGWKIEWPISEGTFEEIKQKLAEEYSHITVHGSDGKKPKKEDFARTLGRCESVRHLSDLIFTESLE
jgi:hypothetical protein